MTREQMIDYLVSKGLERHRLEHYPDNELNLLTKGYK